MNMANRMDRKWQVNNNIVGEKQELAGTTPPKTNMDTQNDGLG